MRNCHVGVQKAHHSCGSTRLIAMYSVHCCCILCSSMFVDLFWCQAEPTSDSQAPHRPPTRAGGLPAFHAWPLPSVLRPARHTHPHTHTHTHTHPHTHTPGAALRCEMNQGPSGAEPSNMDHPFCIRNRGIGPVPRARRVRVSACVGVVCCTLRRLACPVPAWRGRGTYCCGARLPAGTVGPGMAATVQLFTGSP